MLTRADDLARMNVLDERGAPVSLATMWADRAAVLVFVRHFGCMHCRDHVVMLERRIDDLHAAGAEVFVIGNGSPSFIEGFRDEVRWTGPVYTDPTLAVYKAAGLKRGVLATVSLAGAWRSVGTLRRGIKQGRTQGDQWQQGGVLVIAKGGEVLWAHASEGPGDNATAEQILTALKSRAA